MEFIDITKSRYATKNFSGDLIDQDKVDQLKEMIQLSASSFGLQPYHIKVIRDKEIQEKLQAASWNQPQIGTASDVLVFCVDPRIKERIDQYEQLMLDNGADKEKIQGYIGMMRQSMESRSEEDLVVWGAKQAYIALGNALNGAKALGFDSCPMEGFSSDEYKKILGLPEHLTPVVVCPIGIAADTPRPKLRYPLTDLFS